MPSTACYGWGLLVLFTMIPGVAWGADSAAPPNPQDVAHQADTLLLKELHEGDSSRLASLVDDEAFLRRLSLDLIGRNPTPEEITAFVLDPDPAKRAAIIKRLLSDPSFGDNWAAYWRDAIMYRRSEDRALLASTTLSTWLAQQFNDNASWSETVRALVTASGDVMDDGATGLIMAQGGMPEETTAEVSRLFLGIQIQCAQCHDHPTDRWKREEFHHLTAFFPRVAVRPKRDGEQRSFEVAATDRFPFAMPVNNNNRFRGTPEHFMPDLDDPQARGTRMQPVFFLTGQKLDFGASDQERRGQLAEWMTSPDNPWFAKAFVNRIWAEMIGEGFYEPVDDLGPDREATAPQTLDYLAAAFTKSGYDVKWLYTALASTEAYQRESRARRNPDEPAFAASCAQRLRADTLFKNLQEALELPQPRMAPRGPYGLARTPQALFSQTFGYDPSERRDEVSSSIPQALVLMNSPQFSAMMEARPGTMLGRILRELSDDEDAVVELYLRVLARQPSDQELKTCLAYRREVSDRAEAFEDIFWSLINSTEFLHRK